MKVTMRLAGAGLGGTAAVLLLGLVLLPWLGGPSLFGVDIGGVYKALLDEHVRSEAIATRDEAVMRSVRGKEETTRELIAGRVTLSEAMDRFARLSTLMNDGQDELLGTYQAPARNRAELYEHVVSWVEIMLQDRPREQAEALARLKREWDGLPPAPNRDAH